MSAGPTGDLAARYARAAALTPVRSLPRTATGAAEGYWIDAHRFFFTTLVECEGLDDRVEVPHLVDAVSGETRPLLTAAALSGLPEAPHDIALTAQYDMPAPDLLAVTCGEQAWLLRPGDGDLVSRQRLGPPALYSPDGAWAVRVSGYDLVLADRTAGSERMLTAGGEEDVPFGQAPQNDTSPIAYRARPAPVGLWSADSRWFLTHRIDERDLPEAALIQHAPPGGERPRLHRFKLSAVGDRLPRFRYVAIEVASGRTLRSSEDELQAFSPFADRSIWMADPQTAIFVRRDRYRRSAELVAWSLSDGSERILLREDAPSGHLDLHPLFGRQPNVRVLASGEIVWWSERDGYGHLYLYGPDGGLRRRLTDGAFPVHDIVHLDEGRRRLLFTAGRSGEGDEARRRLCAVSLDGGDMTTLFAPEGDVAVRAEPNAGVSQHRPFRPASAPPAVSPDGRHVVARIGSLTDGNAVVVFDLDTPVRRTLLKAPPLTPPPLPLELTAADGETRLPGVLFLPSDFDENRRYPLLDFIYPGPQMAFLPRASATRSELQARAWAELGLAVLIMDCRHMPLRSRAHHQAGYGRSQWEPQLADHAAAADQLCARFAFLDRERVGMIGVSGGGAATAMALFTHPRTYKVGVSAAGNHDSRWYRSIWLDHYVGPLEPDAAAAHAAARFVDGLQGELMLVTGDLDDNVLPSQTLALADALIGANKDFDLLVAPNEGHLALVNSAYVQRRVWDFLVRKLIGGTPPRAYPLGFTAAERAAYGKVLAFELAG